MKRLPILAATAAIVLLGAGCSPTSSDIFPMTTGSVWNMDVLVMAGTTVASLDTFQTGTVVTNAVEKANLTSGEEVVKFKQESSIHMRMPDTTITTTTYAYYRESGDWILGYSALEDSTADTMMVTSPSVGKTWSQGSTTAEVVGQEDVTVTANTYKNAWKVKLTTTTGGQTMEMFVWYAKGTGMVKMHYEAEVQGFETVYDQQLTSATIK